jgi:hypothetical protein
MQNNRYSAAFVLFVSGIVILSRTRTGTEGTSQSRPPLPAHKAGPFMGPAFSCLMTLGKVRFTAAVSMSRRNTLAEAFRR